MHERQRYRPGHSRSQAEGRPAQDVCTATSPPSSASVKSNVNKEAPATGGTPATPCPLGGVARGPPSAAAMDRGGRESDPARMRWLPGAGLTGSGVDSMYEMG